MRKLILLCLPVFLVLSMAWIGYGSDKNLSRPLGDVDFVWNDGEYSVEYDDDGAQYRPLLSTFEFLVVIGEDAGSLVMVVAETAQDFLEAWNPDVNLTVPADAGFFEHVIAWLRYVGNAFRSVIDLIVTVVTLPVKFFLWVCSVLPNVLGFVITGKPIYDMDALTKVIRDLWT